LYKGLKPKETRAFEATDRRRFKRIPVLRPVSYRDPRYGETRSKILDLSIGGAYIESPVLPQGSEIEMEFELINGHMVRVAAVVRYIVLGTGMGVEFQRLSDEDRAQINDFIEKF
jgi:hypothetical protein